MRKRLAIAGLIIVGAVAVLYSISRERLDQEKQFLVSKVESYGFSNFAVLRIDPSEKTLSVSWRSYNRYSNFLRVRREEMTITCNNEHYLITDDGNNNELKVNGRPYRFDGISECLLLKVGSGVSVVKWVPSPGQPSNTGFTPIYQEARKIYQL